MSNDTPTVGEATRALLVEIDDCIERAFAQRGKGSGRIVELTDALIAAVRAEMICPQCEAHGLPSHLIPRS